MAPIQRTDLKNLTPLQRLMSASKTDKPTYTVPIGKSEDNKNGFYPGLELTGVPKYEGPESTLEFLDYLAKNNF